MKQISALLIFSSLFLFACGQNPSDLKSSESNSSSEVSAESSSDTSKKFITDPIQNTLAVDTSEKSLAPQGAKDTRIKRRVGSRQKISKARRAEDLTKTVTLQRQFPASPADSHEPRNPSNDEADPPLSEEELESRRLAAEILQGERDAALQNASRQGLNKTAQSQN